MTRSILRALCLHCLAWLCTGALHAATLLDITAPPPFGALTGSGYFVTSWTQTNTWSNVTIAMPLLDGRPGNPDGTEGYAYLVNRVGPGTTAAHNMAPPLIVTGLGSSFADTTLWTGLTLPPGTYYLILVPITADPTSISPAIPSAPNSPSYATGPGVAVVQNTVQLPNNVPIDPIFPPASPFAVFDEAVPSNFITYVSGDPGPLPQPTATPVPTLGHAALALLSGVLGAAGWLNRRRKA